MQAGLARMARLGQSIERLVMPRLISIHPENPQPRLIAQVVECLSAGGVVVYPTDSSYALGCHIGDKEAMERIRHVRQVDSKHNFTLVCRDLSEIATYAAVDNVAYRLLRTLTPGPYTFILQATREVPRRLQHPKRKTIGIRVPDHKIPQSIIAALGEPLMSSTMVLPGDDMVMTDPQEMQERLGKHVDLVIDGGYAGYELTTVVDLTDGTPEVVRVGKGDPGLFLAPAV